MLAENSISRPIDLKTAHYVHQNLQNIILVSKQSHFNSTNKIIVIRNVYFI